MCLCVCVGVMVEGGGGGEEIKFGTERGGELWRGIF